MSKKCEILNVALSLFEVGEKKGEEAFKTLSLDKLLSIFATMEEAKGNTQNTAFLDNIRRYYNKAVYHHPFSDVCHRLKERTMQYIFDIGEKPDTSIEGAEDAIWEHEMFEDQRFGDQDDIEKLVRALAEAKQSYLDTYGLDKWYLQTFPDEDSDDDD